MVEKKKLRPFKEVLAEQPPMIPGQPIEMTPFHNDLPKSGGNVWKGAYSKHGFWYKFHDGSNQDYEKLVDWAYEQNEMMLTKDGLSQLREAYGEENIHFIVAKDLKRDLLGGILGVARGKVFQIGVYFVQEDFRHSGIGHRLFEEVMMEKQDKTVVFQAMQCLHPSLHRFGLKTHFGRKFVHYKIDNPSGFADLKTPSTTLIQVFSSLTEEQRNSLNVFDSIVSGENRPLQSLFPQKTTFLAAFDEDKCCGYVVSRELHGGHVPRLSIGPLYSDNEQVAEGLIQKALVQYYNPDSDFDFNPDIYAIYRRDVHFIVPEENEKIHQIMTKLRGEKGEMERNRLFYQTSSNGILPGISNDKVYAVGDMHSMII